MGKTITLGIIIGNRDFFPDSLVEKARIEILDVFKKLNLKSVLLDTTDTKLAGVETFKDDPKVCGTVQKAEMKKLQGYWSYCPILEMKREWPIP